MCVIDLHNGVGEQESEFALFCNDVTGLTVLIERTLPPTKRHMQPQSIAGKVNMDLRE
jgi:hypothetical protein